MIWLQVIALLVLLGICSLGPGFFVVRRWRLGPAEKLCVALGVSYVLLYLVAFAFYILKLPSAAYYGASAISAVLLVASGRDFVKLLRNRQVYRLLGGFGLVLLWGLLLLSLVRCYAGGGWSGDWVEHYQRTAFFLGKLPRDFHFIGIEQLPSRPPLMNVLTAFFLAQTGSSFALFQVLLLVLNALIVLPCCLVARLWTKRPGFVLSLCICLFMANPLFIENITYAWTKLLAGFYVVLATWLYVRGWRKRDWRRIVLAFVSLAAGALVHYSVGPYLVFLTLHYVFWAFWRGRPDRWKELGLTALLSAALLMSWFGWSWAVYGRKTTFAANTSVQEVSGRTTGENLAKVAGNLVDSLVPNQLFGYPIRIIQQESAWGLVRDRMFLTYQTTLIAAMGLIGGLVVVHQLYRAMRSPAVPPELRWFWGLFALGCTVLGVVVVGERNESGSAHLCLQPLALMGVAFLAAKFSELARPVRFLLIVGSLTDFGLGILLHFVLQNVVPLITDMGDGRRHLTLADGLNSVAGHNWADKMRIHAYFWGDEFADYGSLLLVLVLAGFALIVWRMVVAAMGETGAPPKPTKAAPNHGGQRKKKLTKSAAPAKR